MIGSPATVESENLIGAPDDGVEDGVAPGLDEALHDLTAVQGAAVVHRAEHAVDAAAWG